MRRYFGSLSGQVFLRLAFVLGLTGLVTAAAALMAYESFYKATTFQHRLDSETHYGQRLDRLDEEWSGRATDLAATIGFFRFLDDVAANEARLTSFLTSSNIGAAFPALMVLDAGGRVLYSLGQHRDLPTDFKAARESWYLLDGTLFRIYIRPVITAAGPLRLVFLRVADNATLYDNAGPLTDLFLVYQGAVVASSLGPLDLATERRVVQGLAEPGMAGIDNTFAISWGKDDTGAPGPRLVVRGKLPPPFSAAQIMKAAALFLGMFAFLAWIAIGQWLTHTAQDIGRLSALARKFTATDVIDRDAIAYLTGPGRGDEVASVTNALGDLMDNVLDRDTERNRYEGELRRRGEEIRLLLDSAGEGFYGVDLKGRCTFVNRTCLKQFGYDSEKELLGQNLHAATHHTRPDGTPNPADDCAVHLTLVTGVGRRVADETYWRKDGTSFPAEIGTFPIVRDGAVTGAVVSVIDITERKAAAETLRRHMIDQEILASILQISLAPAALEQILARSLELVLTSHNLGLQSRGSIFLRNGDMLDMVVNQGLHSHLLTECAHIPLGYCLCGRAAATGVVVFAHEVDDRHDVRFPEMRPHGHYCMPIQTDGEVLGVLNLYVPENHPGGEDELRFVRMVADTLASVIRRHRIEEALLRSEERLRSLVENAGDIILVHDFDGRIVSANRRACQDLDYAIEDFAGLDLADIDAGFDSATYADRWAEMRPGRPIVVESHYRRRDGTVFPVEAHLGYYETGKQPLVVVTAHDITERLKAEEQIKHLASHDTLTGLPNRALVLDRLAVALTAARRSGNQTALLFIDLDGFKPVNDTLGHAAGDFLLREVAARLLTCVREMDTVGRIGGDEFVILMTNIADPTASSRVARLVIRELGRPIPILGQQVTIGASIGIAHAPVDGDTTEQVMALADHAMYEVKQRGKNHFRLASEKDVAAPEHDR